MSGQFHQQVPQDDIKIQLCTSQWAFNLIENFTDKILVIDTRSTYKFMKNQITNL